jgi:two-component system sensor histidine kinase YesM
MNMESRGRFLLTNIMRKLLLRDRSLMTKLTVYSALLVIIPMLFIGMISYALSSQTLEAEARRYSWQIIEQVKRYVEDYLRGYELDTLKIVNHPDTATFLKLKTEEELESSDLVASVRNVLKNFAYSQSDVINITIVLDGLFSLQTANEEDLIISSDIEHEAWYQAVPVTGPPQVYSRLIEWKGRQEPVISILKRIVNPQTLGAYGMLIIDLNYKRLQEATSDIRLGESGQGYLFIVDHLGRIVYHPNQQTIGASIDSSLLHAMQEAESDSFVSGRDADKMLYTYSHSERFDWYIVTAIPYEELMSSRTQMGNSILYTTAASIAIAFILSIGLASSIVRPIKRLYQYMRKVEKGDFNDRVKVESNDELGMLSASFNKMVARLAELVEEVYVSKLRATEMHLREKESELKMLQAQINPHFLYNTLETIRGMALEHDRLEIASVSAALARIMRYNVKQTDTDVTVGQEVEIVDVYLQIQKHRFEERLQYEINIPEWAMDQRIIKLALQPLIENSIIHGLEPAGGQTHISLTAEMMGDDRFCIVIRDDGVGMSADRLEAIRSSLDDAHGDPSHIGLQNVHRRIRHLFGDRYGLNIDSREGAGTVVRLVLPYVDTGKGLNEIG